jgi:hypothetical protein
MKTINVTIGTGEGYTHPSFAAFCTWLKGRDLVANDEFIDVRIDEDQSANKMAYAEAQPAKVDFDHYVLIRPTAGKGVNDLDPMGVLDYGTVGIELTVYQGAGAYIGHGVILEGFRIRVPSASHHSWVGAIGMGRSGTTGTSFNEVRRNRIKTSASVGSTVYAGHAAGTGVFSDNLVIMDGSAALAVVNGWSVAVERNTFVRINGATGKVYGNSYHRNTYFRNNVLRDCGATPFQFDTALDAEYLTNNFANEAISNAPPGITIVTGTNALTRGPNDSRPTAAGPLIGAADSSAISLNDLRGNNRGLSPDAGALQLTPAPALSTGTITSIVADGQSVVVSGTTTQSPTSGTVLLTAVGGEAVTAGPSAVTLGSGTFTITFPGLPTGTYSVKGSLTNGGGTAAMQGGNTVTILGLTGGGEGAPVGGGGGNTHHALVLMNGRLRQVLDAELGTGKKPLVLHNGRLKLRAGSEGTPIVVINGEAVPMPSGDTLLI